MARVAGRREEDARAPEAGASLGLARGISAPGAAPRTRSSIGLLEDDTAASTPRRRARSRGPGRSRSRDRPRRDEALEDATAQLGRHARAVVLHGGHDLAVVAG